MEPDAAFRAKAFPPLRHEWQLLGTRERIVASDGAVLAKDRTIASLVVRCRHLGKPLKRNGLRGRGRRRLARVVQKSDT